jgi:hypothetical protein
VLTPRRGVAVAALASIALGVALPSVASADVPVSQVGWWTRSPQPQSVPEGGIAVGAAPDGALTVAAVLVDAGDGASGSQLRLVETDGTGPIATVQVCPTVATWSAAAGGPMEDAPEGQCDAGVAMTRGEDGTWVADVQPLLDGKTGDVGLLVAPAADSVAFQLSFAPPTVTGSVSEASSGSGSTTATTRAPASSARPSTSPAGSSFVAPATPTPTVASTPTTLAALPDTSTDGSSANAESVAFTPVVGGTVPAGESSRDVGAGTVVLWYVLALVVGAGVAGLHWMRSNGRLTPSAALARMRARP